MAPVRVRGCAGTPTPLGTPEGSSGKPMPGAGETAHVRRLFVDRSRCALEVSPAPRRVPMSLMTGRRAVVAFKSGDTLSRRMWGRRPGRPGGWHADAEGFVVSGADAPGVRAPARSPRTSETRHGRFDVPLNSGLTGRRGVCLRGPSRVLRGSSPWVRGLQPRSDPLRTRPWPPCPVQWSPPIRYPGRVMTLFPVGIRTFKRAESRLESTGGRGTARHTSPR